MLSIKSLGVADSGLANYYESLARDDYYEQGGEPPGQWHGRLADDLGLSGRVKPGQLAAAFRGQHPSTGDSLAKNAGHSHKAGWDLTFSAPKSVSVIWAVADASQQNDMARAHDAAVTRAIAYLEKKAFRSRDRQDPAAARGSLLAAVYQHGTSRELDPQLHSHVVVANLGRRLDGSWCALDFDSRWKMAAGAIYRAELAHQLKQLGYRIEREGTSFQLAGVGEAVMDVFSTRRHQILAALEKQGLTGAKAADVATLATRQAKTEIDRSILMPLWRQQAAALGLDEQALASLQDRQPSQVPGTAALALDDLLKSLTHSHSTFTRMQLEAAVATASQGILDADACEAWIRQQIHERQRDTGSLGLVRLRKPVADSRRDHGVEHYTTREMLAIEQGMLEGARARKGDTRHQVSAAPGLLAHPMLSGEQIQALQHVTESEHGVSVIRGLAGTGKSTLLAAARTSWLSGGLTVIGTALSGKAADGLEAGSGIPSQTLHSLLLELGHGTRQLSASDVIVIDEAGMIGSRQLKKILDHIHAAGSKAVLVGDPQQLQPIEAGGMFRHLSDELGFAELKAIRRQENAADREMIGHLLNGQVAEVLEDLKAREKLVVAPGMDSPEHAPTITDRMVAAWWQQRDPLRAGETLMLAGTRSDVYRLNLLAREKMKAAGSLQNEMALDTERGPRRFGIGERILFTRNDRKLGVKNGQLGTLVKWGRDTGTGTSCTIVVDGGRTVAVNTQHYPHLEYGYALSVHKAQGATVDNVTVLMSDAMADQEWSYVAASRHRKELQVFIAEEHYDLVAGQMARSRQKVVASAHEMEADAEIELEF